MKWRFRATLSGGVIRNVIKSVTDRHVFIASGYIMIKKMSRINLSNVPLNSFIISTVYPGGSISD